MASEIEPTEPLIKKFEELKKRHWYDIWLLSYMIEYISKCRVFLTSANESVDILDFTDSRMITITNDILDGIY